MRNLRLENWHLSLVFDSSFTLNDLIDFISGKKKSKNKKGGDKDFVSLSDIFGANLKRKKTSSETEEGLCLGMCTLWTENHWAIS